MITVKIISEHTKLVYQNHHQVIHFHEVWLMKSEYGVSPGFCIVSRPVNTKVFQKSQGCSTLVASVLKWVWPLSSYDMPRNVDPSVEKGISLKQLACKKLTIVSRSQNNSETKGLSSCSLHSIYCTHVPLSSYRGSLTL